MTPTELREVGRALYGERWGAPLARALGISIRTMRRLAAGQTPIRAGLAEDIYRLAARDRAVQALDRLAALAVELGGPPTEIVLTQGRDEVGRRATALIVEALRELGLAVRVVPVDPVIDDPEARALVAATAPRRR